MKPGLTYFRSDIPRALGLHNAEWTAAKRELKAAGRIIQVGEKRQARYSLSGKRGEREAGA